MGFSNANNWTHHGAFCGLVLVSELHPCNKYLSPSAYEEKSLLWLMLSRGAVHWPLAHCFGPVVAHHGGAVSRAALLTPELQCGKKRMRKIPGSPSAGHTLKDLMLSLGARCQSSTSCYCHALELQPLAKGPWVRLKIWTAASPCNTL